MPTYSREEMTHQVAIGTDPSGAALDPDKALATNLWKDMLAGGFQLVDADTGLVGGIQNNTTKVIMRPLVSVDPLWGTDPWSIYMEVSGSAVMPSPLTGANATVTNTGLYMRIGSSSQLPNLTNMVAGLPSYPLIPNRFEALTTEQYAVANVGVDYPRLSVMTPMAYRLTIVERGFVFASWTQAFTENAMHFGVMCVQRGVSCDGTVSSTGQKPLYMVTNITPTSLGSGTFPGPKNGWFYSIVREIDTTVSQPQWVTQPTNQGGVYGYLFSTNTINDPNEARGTVLNYFPSQWKTPVTTDTGEYILMFPFGLCSNRFAFSDEIDLIAVSKADAYQSGQVVPITVYGEDREYTAYSSNNQSAGINYDSGIRIFVLSNVVGQF